jgi:hypothetical protein
VGLCIPLSLLGNGLVNTAPRQRRVVGDVVFYVARVVLKESRPLIIPRTAVRKGIRVMQSKDPQ